MDLFSWCKLCKISDLITFKKNLNYFSLCKAYYFRISYFVVVSLIKCQLFLSGIQFLDLWPFIIIPFNWIELFTFKKKEAYVNINI